jgi:hypothetical protein
VLLTVFHWMAYCCLSYGSLFLLLRVQHRLMSPLFKARGLTPVSLHPTVLTIQITIASQALQRRIVLTYDTPGVDLII